MAKITVIETVGTMKVERSFEGTFGECLKMLDSPQWRNAVEEADDDPNGITGFPEERHLVGMETGRKLETGNG